MYYRRNIDEDIRDLERRWVAGDESVGLAYANGLLRAGQLELTSFPFYIIKQLFPGGVPDAALLYGESVGRIKQIVSDRFEAFLFRRDPHFPEGPPDFLRRFLPLAGVDTLIWFPNVRELSWRRNWREFDTSSVHLHGGEIDESRLRYDYASLQVDFVLPGHASLNQAYNIYDFDAAMDSNVEIPNYTDLNVLGRNAEYLVIFDSMTPNWEETPSISYGRCMDFPCCGHDMCPPREAESGISLAQICICGKLLSLDATSSICSACLRYGGDEPGVFEDEFQPFEDYEDDFDSVFDGDEDVVDDVEDDEDNDLEDDY